MWCGDDLPIWSYDPMPMDRGDAWTSTGGDATYPEYARPIGFIKRKPRVRIRAWTRPILPKE